MRKAHSLFLLAAGAALVACAPDGEEAGSIDMSADGLVAQYATVRLDVDIGHLSNQQQAMIATLIEAATYMDDAFWLQAYGDREALLESATDPAVRQYLQINYGPWDRLDGDRPFVPGAGEKAAGAGFYPADMTAEEFESAVNESPERADRLRSLYTMVRRNDAGELIAVPYYTAFAEHVRLASVLLKDAAELAEDPGLKRYLELRAEALGTDDYRESDLAWLDMKNNTIEVVIGPIETYEDQLFGYKAAYEAYVLLKDQEWSERLSRFATLLPGLQEGLPVPAEYRREIPGTDSDLNAYDALYYAGHANAGSKTIAINLPNDESVQLEKGTRRLQLKNAMRAKFDRILVPISELLIAEEQRRFVTFDAFFANTMFHEVAHGLGIKNTITGAGTVRGALREHASAMEEGKADVLGLYMVTSLYDQGLMSEGDLRDNYVTFMASIFRSVRFGASSAHGRANMVRFNFFLERGAFSHDAAAGTYRVDFDKMREAMSDLSALILTLQGDGDYAGAGALLSEKGVISSDLQEDLNRLGAAGIPVDIIFEQGTHVLVKEGA